MSEYEVQAPGIRLGEGDRSLEDEMASVQDEAEQESGRRGGEHFATRIGEDVLRYVERTVPASVCKFVFDRSTGVVGAIGEDAPWVSYADMRELLEAAGNGLGGIAELVRVMPTVFGEMGVGTEVLEAVQSLGTPEAAYAAAPALSSNFMPATRVSGMHHGPREWRLTVRLRDGLELFPELRSLFGGLYSAQTVLFGLDPAKVTDTESHNSRVCHFHICWDEVDEQVRARRMAELHARMVTSRITRLQGLIGELALGPDRHHLLRRVMLSAARAVAAPGCLLVLWPGVLGPDRTVISEGMRPGLPGKLADGLLNGDSPDLPERMIAEIRTGTRSFGYLVLIDSRTRLFAHAPGLVRTYAELAATFINAEQAPNTKGVVLDLPSSLAELTTRDEWPIGSP